MKTDAGTVSATAAGKSAGTVGSPGAAVRVSAAHDIVEWCIQNSDRAEICVMFESGVPECADGIGILAKNWTP